MSQTQTVALIAAVGLVVIAVFQVALALGAPLGRAAWGGAYDRLPTRLRIGSAVSAVIWLLAALVILARAGFEAVPISPTVTTWGAWIVVGLLGLGAVVNFASSSRWERFGWGPVSLILAVLCYVVASSP